MALGLRVFLVARELLLRFLCQDPVLLPVAGLHGLRHPIHGWDRLLENQRHVLRDELRHLQLAADLGR